MVDFAGIVFRGLTLDDVFAAEPAFAQVVTVNAEYIVLAHENERLGNIVRRAITTFDGQVPYTLARLTNKHQRFEKLPGSELLYHICERALARGERVFLLGGKAESNRGALEALREKYRGLAVDGWSPPHAPLPFPAEQETFIMHCLESFRPQYVLVGFGAGKQDFWIDEHREALASLGVKRAVGVGGAFDMVSGKISRAPRYIQRLGLEGVHRLLKEPKWFRVRRLIISLRFLRYL